LKSRINGEADHQYDYPSDIAESVQDLSTTAASAWSSFANKNLKVSLLAHFIRAKLISRTPTYPSQFPLREWKLLISPRPFPMLSVELPRMELQI
jgi:hypothetical protein